MGVSKFSSIRLAAAAALIAGAASAQDAAAERSWFQPAQFEKVCGGDCYGTLYAGQFVESNMSEIFFYGEPVAPWAYRMREDYIVSASLSRRVMTLWDVIDIELEAGLDLRFGEERANEVWGAVYARWTRFPWNGWVRTTFAVNTGLSYADNVTDRERRRSETPKGSRLLHYLAPELTFAAPDWEETQVVLRFHHRSGGRNIWGDTDLFKNVSGGAQYWALGLRQRF